MPILCFSPPDSTSFQSSSASHPGTEPEKKKRSHQLQCYLKAGDIFGVAGKVWSIWGWKGPERNWKHDSAENSMMSPWYWQQLALPLKLSAKILGHSLMRKKQLLDPPMLGRGQGQNCGGCRKELKQSSVWGLPLCDITKGNLHFFFKHIQNK